MRDHDPTMPENDPPSARWAMLAIVSAGFIAMTINWFDISTGFPAIGKEFDKAIPDVAFLISVFVAAYGILHIPGGLLATKWGLRRTLALGLAIEAAGALLSATSTSFAQLVLWRAVAGVGASIFAAVGIAAVSIWFRDHQHALALGISSAAFSVGTALGLYTFADITDATTWRTSVVIGGILCLAVAGISALFFRVPKGAGPLAGAHLTRAGLQQALFNKDIWLYGLAFFGAYGSYLGASQLISGYGDDRHIPGGQVGAAAFLIGVAGVPGSIAAGWLADRYLSPRILFAAGAVLEAVALACVPLSGPNTFWIPAFAIGFMFNFVFAVWQTVPGGMRGLAPENIGTAIGLMLTISAAGGFVLPWAFGLIVDGPGYGAAWTFLAVVSAATVAFCLPARSAARTPRPSRKPGTGRSTPFLRESTTPATDELGA
ncbi:MFS transporter [Actinomadura graeca]|uniref:MFS transporter n=1 Tax=Actinomadura graeca TaxID=2750812 RepID=A0ABX8QXD9_9ACTN|nr:MFS transporter [Actinomadura graeca]QXJ22834.1 MFS transporter [Actinomadura graeca]